MKQLIKKIYKAIPFKQPFFSVVKHIVSLPNSIYKHLYFDGIISFAVNGKKVKMNQKGYDVENTLFWKGVKGCWEKVSVDLWIKLCSQSTIILDIGANTGAYALIAKIVNEKATVYAFEPFDIIYDRLVANTKLNNLNIQCVRFAISDYDGVAKVYPESLDHIYSVTVNKNLSPGHIKVHEVEIKTKKLKTFISENDLPGIDLMKIDVETHEPELLIGMEDYLSKWKPTMLIEILTDEVGEKVQGIVKGMGYMYFNIDEKGSIKLVERIGKSDYYNYLLCSPEKAKFLNLI
jgi:FkbM family methyltransferase